MHTCMLPTYIGTYLRLQYLGTLDYPKSAFLPFRHIITEVISPAPPNADPTPHP